MQPIARYLGQIPFRKALQAQANALESGEHIILGFETIAPVVTLGVRADETDAQVPSNYEVVRVDRGGQATLHNPGQLVIFPVVGTRAFGGPRAWVEHLVRVTQNLARAHATKLHYDPRAPGLYDEKGAKVVALGVRLAKGISTHGLAINVRNDLAAFAPIRACGRHNASVAHLDTKLTLAQLFDQWVKEFTDAASCGRQECETHANPSPNLLRPPVVG